MKTFAKIQSVSRIPNTSTLSITLQDDEMMDHTIQVPETEASCIAYYVGRTVRLTIMPYTPTKR